MRKCSAKSLEDITHRKKLNSYLSGYLKACRPPPEADPKRAVARFPNIAGFCRFLGCGIAEFESFRLSHPMEADYVCTVLEDEALNTQVLSPTLSSAYLKRRLGYAEKNEPTSQATCGEVRVIFEHDITEDGA